MTIAEAITKIEALSWTQEIRPDHPWNGDLLVRKDDALEIVKSIRA